MGVIQVSDYKRIATSAEVWAVIRAKHSDHLEAFMSYSAPDGDEFGDGVMQTGYGFKGADYPFIEVKTTWRIDREKPSKRLDELREYWLCIPVKDAD